MGDELGDKLVLACGGGREHTPVPWAHRDPERPGQGPLPCGSFRRHRPTDRQAPATCVNRPTHTPKLRLNSRSSSRRSISDNTHAARSPPDRSSTTGSTLWSWRTPPDSATRAWCASTSGRPSASGQPANWTPNCSSASTRDCAAATDSAHVQPRIIGAAPCRHPRFARFTSSSVPRSIVPSAGATSTRTK